MEGERLYIVQGRGNDAVGLVGKIAKTISQVRGNVVDLRQDVLHGLFTVQLVVDLSATELRIEEFQALVERLGEDTGLALSVDKYVPVGRLPGKRSILVILVGPDQPGIIAAACEALGSHRANIEFSQTIAREGVFLMELLTDVSHCTIPIPNLQASVERALKDLGIRALFQTEDVFNKKKRVILFSIASSFIDREQRTELLEHTKLTEADLAKRFPADETACLACLRTAAGLLDGMPSDLLTTLAETVTATDDSLELLQTLKVMGYKIALASTAFSPFTDSLPERLGIDHCRGLRLPIDDDERTVLGEISDEDFEALRPDTLVPQLARLEGIPEADVTLVDDAGAAAVPGIHLRLDLGRLLSLYNDRTLSSEQLLGIVGALGVPQPGER